MGRPRGSTVSSSSEAASKVDDKSKGIVRTSTRERKELLPSYNEDSSRSEESEMSEGEDEVVSDYKESVSESVSEPESSGSEYGKKKKPKGKITPVKKPAKGGRGRKSSSLSPKKGGRKPAAKKASPAKGRGGRKPAAAKKPAATPTRSRPQRGQATKRLKYKERGSDSEDEESVELSESDVEEIEQESEESVQEQMSDSENDTKSRKRKAPGVEPKGRAAKGRKSEAAENGNGKKKDVDEDDEEEEEEDEEEDKVKEKKEDKNGKAEETSNGSAKKEKKEDKKDKAEKMEEDEEDDEAEDEEKEREETDKKIVEKKDKEIVEAKDKAVDKKEEKEEEDEDEADVESLKGSVASSKDGEPKNPIDTDYSTINFDCDKKSKAGEPWNLKISCWNIGGIRSWIKKNGLEYLEKEKPDVMCVQEVKATEKNMPPELGKLADYPHVYWSYSETGAHHGVGILSKTKPVKVTYGLPAKDGDSDAVKKLKEQFTKEGRLVVAEYDKYILVNVYVPNSGSPVKDESKPKPYPKKIVSGERIEWDRLFREYVKELDAEKPVIVTGDMNCAHAEIDLTNPKPNVCNAGFTKEEREDFTKLLEEAKLIDTFRNLHPDKKDAFTFWSYRLGARAKNIGWRLDYFLLSSKLQDSLVENTMRSTVLGSDHCPLVLFLHV